MRAFWRFLIDCSVSLLCLLVLKIRMCDFGCFYICSLLFWGFWRAFTCVFSMCASIALHVHCTSQEFTCVILIYLVHAFGFAYATCFLTLQKWNLGFPTVQNTSKNRHILILFIQTNNWVKALVQKIVIFVGAWCGDWFASIYAPATKAKSCEHFCTWR